MLDKYGVGQDPYCYPGSSVLRNRLDLLDEQRLHQAERELSEIAVGSLPLFPPPYDLDRLQYIHRTLFGDIYDWAGELRSVNIRKGDTLFCTRNASNRKRRRSFGTWKMQTGLWARAKPNW